MVTTTTTWKFYLNSEDAWGAMLEAIKGASLSIDIEQYIFVDDMIGKKFIDLLKEKAVAGIRIRILCDDFGSFRLTQSDQIKEMQKLGIEIKFFNPILSWRKTHNREFLFYPRNHRRSLIIDGDIGFTGGICLSDEMRLWRESHIQVKGGVVDDMKRAFEVMWFRQYRYLKYLFKKVSPTDTVEEFKYLTNAPLPRKRFMYYELLKAIKRAKKYMYLTTPYFLPNPKLLKAIKSASKRGVHVKLLVPYSCDSRVVLLGSQTFFTTLLEHNIEVFRYQKMIHSKTIVIDGEWSTIGSLNLDNVSLRYNFEGNLVSVNKEFALDIEKQFCNDMETSTKLSFEVWKRRGLFQKCLELIVWPIRQFL